MTEPKFVVGQRVKCITENVVGVVLVVVPSYEISYSYTYLIQYGEGEDGWYPETSLEADPDITLVEQPEPVLEAVPDITEQ